MKTNYEKTLSKLVKSISELNLVDSDSIPDIGLYMDQVTTFMEREMSSSKRYGDDKIITKTMINNYTKNHILPPPEKKRYSKDHIILLIFIYYMKNFLSFSDIDKVLDLISENTNFSEGSMTLTGIYNRVRQLEVRYAAMFEDEIQRHIKISSEVFPESPSEYIERLRLFSLISSLSMDIFYQKQLLEKLIDTLPEPEPKNTK